MFSYILAGGFFTGYLISAVINRCISSNNLTKKIDILVDKLEGLDVYLSTQNDRSDLEYYNYLLRLEAVCDKFIELQDDSLLCRRLNPYWMLCAASANEFSQMDPQRLSMVLLDVIHNLATYHMTGHYMSDQLEAYDSPPSYSNALTELIIMAMKYNPAADDIDTTNELDTNFTEDKTDNSNIASKQKNE